MKRIAILMAACFCLLPSLSAQEIRKYEIGVDASYGFKVDKFKANNYGFDLFGGYRFNDHFSAGAGLSYINFNGRMDLPSGIEDVGIWTDNYSAYRPFVYGRYDFLPNRKWTPFVGVRLGYAFFRNTSLHYTVLATGTAYDPIDMSAYEYLRDLDHTLGVKGSVFGTIDLGVARHIGTKGGKISIGVFLDVQPVKFTYYKNEQKRINTTIGSKIGVTF